MDIPPIIELLYNFVVAYGPFLLVLSIIMIDILLLLKDDESEELIELKKRLVLIFRSKKNNGSEKRETVYSIRKYMEESCVT